MAGARATLVISGGPVRNVSDGTFGMTLLVLIVVAMISIIGMSMAPVPVLRLLLLFRLGIFVRIPVVFAEVLVPGAILVVVPVVIILVLSIVDADLNVGLLRCGCCDHGYWCRQGSGQE